MFFDEFVSSGGQLAYDQLARDEMCFGKIEFAGTVVIKEIDDRNSATRPEGGLQISEIYEPVL